VFLHAGGESEVLGIDFGVETSDSSAWPVGKLALGLGEVCWILARSRRTSRSSCAARTRRNAVFTEVSTRIFCSWASIRELGSLEEDVATARAKAFRR